MKVAGGETRGIDSVCPLPKLTGLAPQTPRLSGTRKEDKYADPSDEIVLADFLKSEGFEYVGLYQMVPDGDDLIIWNHSVAIWKDCPSRGWPSRSISSELKALLIIRSTMSIGFSKRRTLSYSIWLRVDTP